MFTDGVEPSEWCAGHAHCGRARGEASAVVRVGQRTSYTIIYNTILWVFQFYPFFSHLIAAEGNATVN